MVILSLFPMEISAGPSHFGPAHYTPAGTSYAITILSLAMAYATLPRQFRERKFRAQPTLFPDERMGPLFSSRGY